MVLPTIPSWIPGETLFSWCGGFHLNCKAGSAKDTSQILFGNVHAPRLPDLPSCLNHFCQVTGGLLGAPEVIARQRTVFGYLSSTSSQRQIDLSLAAMRANSASCAKARLGLPARRFEAKLPLKYCRACADDDMAIHARTVWHLEHQWPTTWICRRHACLLQIATDETATWRLPPEAALDADELQGRDVRVLQAAARIGQLLVAEGPVDPLQLRKGTLQALAQLGVVKVHLQVDRGAIGRWLASTEAAAVLARYAAVFRGDLGWAWADELVLGRRALHPAAWVALWTAMCQRDSGIEDLFLSAVRTGAVRTQFTFDFGETRDPRSEIPDSFEEELLASEGLADSAMRMGVSAATIKRWLKTMPELNRRWMSVQRARRLDLAQRRIQESLATDPPPNRAELLRTRKADVAWLSSNAPDVLRDALDQVPSVRVRQRSLFN